MEIKILKNKNFIYKVKENETLKDISNKFKILESKIMLDNCLTSKTVLNGDLLYIACQNSVLYVVKPLDNLEKIAKKLNVSVNEIIEKNNLQTNNLFIGQNLVV